MRRWRNFKVVQAVYDLFILNFKNKLTSIASHIFDFPKDTVFSTCYLSTCFKKSQPWVTCQKYSYFSCSLRSIAKSIFLKADGYISRPRNVFSAKHINLFNCGTPGWHCENDRFFVISLKVRRYFKTPDVLILQRPRRTVGNGF